jgi:hypothetical protein
MDRIQEGIMKTELITRELTDQELDLVCGGQIGGAAGENRVRQQSHVTNSTDTTVVQVAILGSPIVIGLGQA